MEIIQVTDANFKTEVLSSDKPFLLDFWAPWCHPCKMIAPLLEELAREYQQKIKIGKLNVDDNPQVSTHYSIMSIPTLIFFCGGKVRSQITGAVSKSELRSKIEEHVA
jgi:thioredoxin 1